MSKLTVHHNSNIFEYDGDYIAGLNPANALIISEMMPDVTNTNDGNPRQVIRAIYNKEYWSKVIIDE